jgi:LPXTG-motif cell wall-anchored protein
MSYSLQETEKANQECRHLVGRKGEGTKIGDRWVINSNYGGNTDCFLKSSTNPIIQAGFGNMSYVLIGGALLFAAIIYSRKNRNK